MLKKLSRDDRLLLLRFVCSFAWADLEVRDAEKKFVNRLVDKLGLDEAERKQVAAWLRVPPAPEDVDPAKVPREHRKLFLDAAREMIGADGEIAPDERENLELFEALLK